MASTYEIEIEVTGDGAAALESMEEAAGALEKQLATVNDQLRQMGWYIDEFGRKRPKVGDRLQAPLRVLPPGPPESIKKLRGAPASDELQSRLMTFTDWLASDVGEAKIREWASILREFAEAVIWFGNQLETKVVPNLKSFIDLFSKFDKLADSWLEKLPLITEDVADFGKEVGKIGLAIAPFFNKLRDIGKTTPTGTGIWEWIDKAGDIASILGLLGLVLSALSLIATVSPAAGEAIAAAAAAASSGLAPVLIIAGGILLYLAQIAGLIALADWAIPWVGKKIWGEDYPGAGPVGLAKMGWAFGSELVTGKLWNKDWEYIYGKYKDYKSFKEWNEENKRTKFVQPPTGKKWDSVKGKHWERLPKSTETLTAAEMEKVRRMEAAHPGYKWYTPPPGFFLPDSMGYVQPEWPELQQPPENIPPELWRFWKQSPELPSIPGEHLPQYGRPTEPWLPRPGYVPPTESTIIDELWEQFMRDLGEGARLVPSFSPEDFAYPGGYPVGALAAAYGGEGGAGKAITLYQTIEKVDINTTEKVDADSLLEVARTLLKKEADTLS